MPNIDIRSLILQAPIGQKQEDTPAAPRQRKAVEFRAELQSGCDFVVSRTTPKTRKLLVVLVSQKQYYIKDESNSNLFDAAVEALCEENFAKFSEGMPEESIALPEVSWLDVLPRGKDERSRFFCWLDLFSRNPEVWDLAKKGFWHCRLLDNRYIGNECDEDPTLWSRTVDLIATHEGKTKKDVLRGYENNILQGTGFASLCDMKKTFGQEIALYYVETALRNHVERVPACPFVQKALAKKADSPVYRFNGRCNYVETAPEWTNPYSFDGRRLADYLVYDADHQGLDPNDALNILVDTLDMQKAVFGKIREKYPRNLETEHRIMMKLYNQVKQEIDAEKWNEAAKSAADLQWSDDKYTVISPKTPADMYDEAQQQSNCLRGYVPSVIAGRCLILFLRLKAAPEKSLVSIEVLPDGTVGQTYRAFNKKPSAEELDFIRRWAKKKGLAFEGMAPPRGAYADPADEIGTARIAG